MLPATSLKNKHKSTAEYPLFNSFKKKADKSAENLTTKLLFIHNTELSGSKKDYYVLTHDLVSQSAPQEGSEALSVFPRRRSKPAGAKGHAQRLEQTHSRAGNRHVPTANSMAGTPNLLQSHHYHPVTIAQTEPEPVKGFVH